jgi:tetratricopeptide (TPR) repeat protein
MRSALATASKAARSGPASRALALALLPLVLALAGCGNGNGGDGTERTVLLTRRGESSIQVTESERDGNQIVRISTVFQGQENIIVLDIDLPVYDVEIPLSLEQVMPAAAAAQVRGPEGQFQDLLIAQTLQKAQQAMVAGDYNGALQQVDVVLQIKPNHVQAHAMKGSVYYALGNYELANEEWEYVLSLDPSNKEVQDFKEFLRNRPATRPPALPGTPGTGGPGGAPRLPGTPGGTGTPPPGAQGASPR